MAVMGYALWSCAGTVRDTVRTARAAAARRSGETAGLRRRWRRANNRRSWFCSSEAFHAKRIPLRVKETGQNLKLLGGVGIAYPRGEEAEAKGQHDDVPHEVLLCAMSAGREELPSRRLVGW